MDNKDFRDRLRDHKSTPNMQTWEQMSAILDSTESKPKRRGLMLWLVLAGVVALIGIFGTYLYVSANSKIELDTVITEDRTLSENSSATINTAPATVSGVNKKQAAPQQDQSNTTTETAPLASIVEKNRSSSTDQSSSIKEEPQSSRLSSTGERVGSSRIDTSSEKEARPSFTETAATARSDGFDIATRKNDRTLEGAKSTAAKPVTTAGSNQEARSSTVANSAPKTLVTALQPSHDEGTKVNVPNAKNEEPENQLNEPKKPTAAVAKAALSIQQIGTKTTLLSLADRTLGRTNITKVPRPSRLHLMAHSGYASVNNSKGAIVGVGLVYELDRIIGFELGSNFSYGTEQGVDAGSLRTREYQADLTGLIHLYFINNRKHKLSFDFGTGYSYFNLAQAIRKEDEPDQLRLKSNFGRHLQGRISYQYAINADQSLGLHFGVISYDDAVSYLSFKFVNRL